MSFALIDQILRNTTFLAAGLAAVMFWLGLSRKQPALTEIGTLAMGSGLLTASLAVIWQFAHGHAQPSSLYDALFYAAWGMLGLFQVFQRRYNSPAFGAGAAPAVFVPAVLASVLAQPSEVAAAQNPAFCAYVILLQLAFGAFGLAAACGLQYTLAQDRTAASLQLKPQGPNIAFAAVMAQDVYPTEASELSPLILFDEIGYRLILSGLLLLGLGSIASVLWAQQALGASWSWTPQQTALLMTWLFYAGYLHFRLRGKSDARHAAQLALVAFVAVVFSCYQLSFLPWHIG